jgi:hypothetical protein
MDISTILLQLSSSIQSKLTNSNFLCLLSAIKELSAVPFHPYEKIKYNLFGKDATFKTINDIELPNNFCPLTYTHKMTALGAKTNQMSLCALSGLKNIESKYLETAITVDTETLKRNIEFVEIVKTINIKDINTKPIELMQKLTSYYINNCS